MSKQITVAELAYILDRMVDQDHGEAKVFAYVGADGLKIQAESENGDGWMGWILKAPSVMPSAGGPCY